MSTRLPILVLDGDPRPELARRGIPLRPAPGAPPLPVREPGAVRSFHADSTLAGSDVVTAMTGDLHRRALARIGASRRVREWVGVALDLAREAAAEAEDADRAERAGEPAPPVRVAGLVWPLEEHGGPEAAPDVAVASAEHRAHAGALADGGAALLRIERIGTIAESEAATIAAIDTGVETWTGIVLDERGVALPSGEPVSAWLSTVVPLKPAGVLLEARTWDATIAGLDVARAALDILDPLGIIALGVALPAEAPAPQPEGSPHPEARLLGAGATLLSAGPDGCPQRVAALRAAADAQEATRVRERRPRQDRTAAWLAQASERALPGPALWLATGPAALSEVPLPDRFSWQVADPATVRQLPAEHFRLTVLPAWDALAALDAGTVDWVRLLVDALEPGGWLLVEGSGALDAMASDARLGDIRPILPTGPCASSWLARRRP
ncbi:MAG: homocysteine S-methyltransferase family protein [Candidatus Limnocylindrales bacterium]